MFVEFDHNLFFIEAAARDPGSAYLRSDRRGREGEMGLLDLERRVGGRGGRVLPPLFQAHGIEHRRSISRLSGRSPAIDAGREAGAPPTDRFDNPRPQGAAVDIGHHERAP